MTEQNKGGMELWERQLAVPRDWSFLIDYDSIATPPDNFGNELERRAKSKATLAFWQRRWDWTYDEAMEFSRLADNMVVTRSTNSSDSNAYGQRIRHEQEGSFAAILLHVAFDGLGPRVAKEVDRCHPDFDISLLMPCERELVDEDGGVCWCAIQRKPAKSISGVDETLYGKIVYEATSRFCRGAEIRRTMRNKLIRRDMMSMLAVHTKAMHELFEKGQAQQTRSNEWFSLLWMDEERRPLTWQFYAVLYHEEGCLDFKWPKTVEAAMELANTWAPKIQFHERLAKDDHQPWIDRATHIC